MPPLLKQRTEAWLVYASFTLSVNPGICSCCLLLSYSVLERLLWDYCRLCFTLLPAVCCWNTWTRGVSSDTNRSLVSVIKSSTKPSKFAWKAGYISLLCAAAAGQLLVPEVSGEVSSGSEGWWYSLQCRPRAAIEWSLFIFYVLSIIQQEKWRISDSYLRRRKQREWAHVRGCWAGLTCALAMKDMSSSVTDVMYELGLVTKV